MNNDIITLKFCPNCADIGCIDDKFLKYHIKGYKATYNSNDIDKCTDCGCDLIDCGISCNDYITITHISLKAQFLEEMIKLHDTDIIEYESRMSQFRMQAKQQEQIEQENIINNKPHCPTCGSTDIKKISGTSKAASVTLWGIFSQKVKKTYHCNNCKYEW